MKQKVEAKTKMRLRMALIVLMETQHFTSITVNDICEQAYVGRSTFYDHFQDKYDLLNYMLTVFSEEISSNLEHETLFHKIEYILGLLKAQAPFFYRLKASDLNHEVTQIMRSVWRNSIVAKVPEFQDSDMYRMRFVSGGFINVVIEWIENGLDTPVETLSDMMVNLINDVLNIKKSE